MNIVMNKIKNFLRGEADIEEQAFVLIFIGFFGSALLSWLLGMVYVIFFK